MPANKQNELEVEVKMLLENGLIRPSGSPWASPVVLVAKTGGGVRLCVDYRRLNGITKPDPFPLPRIDELIDGLARARYHTGLSERVPPGTSASRLYIQNGIHHTKRKMGVPPNAIWAEKRTLSVPANDECGNGRHGFLRCRLH